MRRIVCQHIGQSGVLLKEWYLCWGLEDEQVLGNCRTGSLHMGEIARTKAQRRRYSEKEGKTCQTQGKGFFWGELGKGLGSKWWAVGTYPFAIEDLS